MLPIPLPKHNENQQGPARKPTKTNIDMPANQQKPTPHHIKIPLRTATADGYPQNLPCRPGVPPPALRRLTRYTFIGAINSGVKLAVPPDKLTVADILTATGEKFIPAANSGEDGKSRDIGEPREILRICQNCNDMVLNYLGSITLADLCSGEKNSHTYPSDIDPQPDIPFRRTQPNADTRCRSENRRPKIAVAEKVYTEFLFDVHFYVLKSTCINQKSENNRNYTGYKFLR